MACDVLMLQLCIHSFSGEPRNDRWKRECGEEERRSSSSMWNTRPDQMGGG